VVAGGTQGDLSRERLHWFVEVAGGTHDVEILPGLLRSIGIDLDGHRVAEVLKPDKQHPWREVSFDCDGHPAAAALTWAFPVMHTDLFIDGRSLIDGRGLEAARQAAPEPARGYNLWMDPGFRLGIDHLRFLPRGVLVAVVAALLVFAAFVAAGRRVSGPLAGGAVLLDFSVLAGAWLYWWLVVTVRLNRYLLAHCELGDARRLAAFWAAFLGWPVVTFGFAAIAATVASR
jgi:hypothetical protein